MQKFFNLAGALGFLMSGTMVVGSLVLYTRIPSLTKYYMSELKLELTKVMTQMVPDKLDDVMPELPSATGPAIETPKLPF
nr:plasmid stability protein [uncultured Mediterranean phage uvMED]|tara:strand:- start:280 stop:519 length:240 start_codon:yes stop_codon:yes gene_type:complete